MLHNGRIAGVRGKETDSIVSPVIVELYAVHHLGVFHFIKLKNRHQLYGIDTQVLQIRYLLAKSLIGSPCGNAGGLVFREPPDVHFINDQIL